jgi:hypothetical protein
MSEPILSEMREVVPLGEYETVNLIEFGRTGGGYRLFLNGRELPFYTPRGGHPVLEISPTAESFDVLNIQLLVEPGAEMRRFELAEPLVQDGWVDPGLL